MTALAIARLRRQLAGAHPTAAFQARLAAAREAPAPGSLGQ
jgi:hypothetical protein